MGHASQALFGPHSEEERTNKIHDGEKLSLDQNFSLNSRAATSGADGAASATTRGTLVGDDQAPPEEFVPIPLESELSQSTSSGESAKVRFPSVT
jgi:hypothetical protein